MPTRARSLPVRILLGLLLALPGCANKGTSDFMRKVNGIRPGTEQAQVRKSLGQPDSQRGGVVPVRRDAEGAGDLFGSLAAGTRYERWVYPRGDSHYHVLFRESLTKPGRWEVASVRSTPSTAVY